MPKRLFLNVIEEMKQEEFHSFGIINSELKIIASSCFDDIGKIVNEIKKLDLTNELIECDLGLVKKLSVSRYDDYVVYIAEKSEKSRIFLTVFASAINCIMQYYDERYDKLLLIKNIVQNNIFDTDIAVKSKELHLVNEKLRACLCIQSYNTIDLKLSETISSCKADDDDIVFNISDKEAVFVATVDKDDNYDYLYQLALKIIKTVRFDKSIDIGIGIGSIVTDLASLAKSYEQARSTLVTFRVFAPETEIAMFDKLGVYRLISHLSDNLCKEFLSEMFTLNYFDELDEETIMTINCFFENNLNVSETARKLFVHRNTLVYRLDKIKKQTGLDLRDFDSSIVFKLALLINRQLNANL